MITFLNPPFVEGDQTGVISTRYCPKLHQRVWVSVYHIVSGSSENLFKSLYTS